MHDVRWLAGCGLLVSMVVGATAVAGMRREAKRREARRLMAPWAQPAPDLVLVHGPRGSWENLDRTAQSLPGLRCQLPTLAPGSPTCGILLRWDTDGQGQWLVCPDHGTVGRLTHAARMLDGNRPEGEVQALADVTKGMREMLAERLAADPTCLRDWPTT